MDNTYLCHYGVKGMKWGVRRYQNADGSLTTEGKKRYSEITKYGETGGTIKKGSVLYRVSVDPNDKTFDNKKYVSTSEYDNALWEDYMVPAYKSRGFKVYSVRYKTMSDIKVASQTELGRRFCEHMTKSPDQAIGSTVNSYRRLGLNVPENIGYAKAASVNMAAQTKLGKLIADELLASGYDAVTDTHGQNTSNDPIIILDPDKKIKRVSQVEY